MSEFCRDYISPNSSKRARISLRLDTWAVDGVDAKVVDILSANLQNAPAESRQSIDALKQHLEKDRKLPEDIVGPIIATAEEAGLMSMRKEVTRWRDFKAGLMPSEGVRFNRDLTEFKQGTVDPGITPTRGDALQ